MLWVLKLAAWSLLSIGAFAVTPGDAAGQEFPNRPIKIIVPNTPGSVVDVVPRIVAPEMSRLLGQPVVVENKPGAGSLLGVEYVATGAPADGYTLLVGVISNTALFPLTIKDLRFDPLKDLVPVIGLTEGKLALGSPAS